jgi:hypothetical protein
MESFLHFHGKYLFLRETPPTLLFCSSFFMFRQSLFFLKHHQHGKYLPDKLFRIKCICCTSTRAQSSFFYSEKLHVCRWNGKRYRDCIYCIWCFCAANAPKRVKRNINALKISEYIVLMSHNM